MTIVDLDKIIKAAGAYEDGDTGIDRCIELYCQEHGIDSEVSDAACRKAHTDGALAAGIPRSVIEGKSKLSDHFSQEYIDHMRGGKD